MQGLILGTTFTTGQRSGQGSMIWRSTIGAGSGIGSGAGFAKTVPHRATMTMLAAMRRMLRSTIIEVECEEEVEVFEKCGLFAVE